MHHFKLKDKRGGNNVREIFADASWTAVAHERRCIGLTQCAILNGWEGGLVYKRATSGNGEFGSASDGGWMGGT